MSVDCPSYKKNIDNDIFSLQLIEKAKKSLYGYYEETMQSNPTDGLVKNITQDTLKRNISLLSYGVRFNVKENDAFEYCIIFQVTSEKNTFLYNYYSYFDIKGELVDNFIDK